jgi:transposase
MGDTNKRYTKEFKVSAVKLVTEQGLTASKAADDLGVSKSAISTWLRQFKENGTGAFPGSGNLLSQDEEIRRLRRELQRVEMERDILKKATMYFAELEKRNLGSSRQTRRSSTLE